MLGVDTVGFGGSGGFEGCTGGCTAVVTCVVIPG